MEEQTTIATTATLPGGTWTMGDLEVHRLGYGAMQLAGPGVFGPPTDRAAALEVLREVVALGIDHIDTSDFYGPYVTNEIIREALHPYREGLHIVTKVGARRDEAGAWLPASSREQLRTGLHRELDRLGLEAMDVVNLRIMEEELGAGGADAVREPFTALAELQQEGLIRHLGISTVTAPQIAAAREIAPIVCVQNEYNLAHRGDDELIDSLASEGIAYVPYFPLGGFSPLQDQELDAVAAGHGAGRMAVALAWLLQRSPNILLIPGTSSVAHLRENVAGAGLALTEEDRARLDAIGR